MTEEREQGELSTDKKKVEETLKNKLVNRVASRLVGQKAKRESPARLGIAFWGSAGWYIPVPTAIGALIGRWLDGKYPQEGLSWSLNLMLVGLVFGVFAAAQWLKREAIDQTLKNQAEREQQIAEMQKEGDARDTK